jgi:predicted acylesterase/phospholipase RssA
MDVSRLRPFKLLSLDGGGVRGLSSIMILKALMRNLHGDATVHPWQEFDLIAGTSTGGLLAIMLGRLRMSIDTCEAAYADFAADIFTPRRRRANLLGQSIDFLKVNGKFDEEPLERNLKRFIEDADLDAEELLHDMRSESPKVFVCATQVSDNAPTLIRSYDNPKAFGDLTGVKIWEAGRATSAASGFFDPITIGRNSERFADGALHYNNPVQLVLQESYDLWPTGERLLISIGTGSTPGKPIDSGLKDLVSQLVCIATETEETAHIFTRVHEDMARADRLFRFNVFHGLGDIGLDESKEIEQIAARTRTYLRNPEVARRLTACVNALRVGPHPTGINLSL